MQRPSVYILYITPILVGKKGPAGAHLDTPSLESAYFKYPRHKNTCSLFIKFRRCFFGGKKPCGSALGHTELRKYMFYAFKTQKSRFSIIEGFCHDPTSDFPTRFSDGHMKNSTYVVATR